MKKDNNNIFLIVLFAVLMLVVLLFPKIYSTVENSKLPHIEKTEHIVEEEKKELTDEILESIHYPLMRSSKYDSNTYYSLEKFTINDMSNSDILYNAFLDIYEGNITNSDSIVRCTNTAKEFNINYLKLRIKNILGKNVDYDLSDFYVPEDSSSNYKGNWLYAGDVYIYDGLCDSNASNIEYYNLEDLIKSEFNNDDIDIYYYVGFAKVEGNTYIIYKDPEMTKEIKKGTFTTLEDLNNEFKGINTKDKRIYKYTFKDTLCTYNEYCLYEGKWVNDL